MAAAREGRLAWVVPIASGGKVRISREDREPVRAGERVCLQIYDRAFGHGDPNVHFLSRADARDLADAIALAAEYDEANLEEDG
jgi:hypothetical protein